MTQANCTTIEMLCYGNVSKETETIPPSKKLLWNLSMSMQNRTLLFKSSSKFPHKKLHGSQIIYPHNILPVFGLTWHPVQDPSTPQTVMNFFILL